jgi:hypothetical protein
LALRRGSGDALGVAVLLIDLARLLHAQGDAEQALVHYRESLALCGALRQARVVGQCLEGIAHIAAARGQPERAAYLAGAAAALRQVNGMPLEPDQSADYERMVANVRATLGDDAYAAAHAMGAAQPIAQVIAACRDMPL